MGDFDKAEEYYRKAASSSSQNAAPYLGLATVAVQRSDLDKALILYQKAAAVEETDKALCGIGLVYMCATLLPKKEKKQTPLPQAGARFWLPVALVCLVMGAYDGFFGPGTGSFLILAFHWILRMGLMEASATSKVLNLASNFAGAVVFIINGVVVWSLALPMAAACCLGNWMGSRMAIRIGPAAVRRFLTISLSLLLITLVWQYFLAPALH